MLITYGGAHYKIIRPIYKSLLKNFSEDEVILLALTTAQSSCDKDRIQYRTLKSYKHLFDINDIFKIGKSLISRSDVNLDYEESLLYHGLSFSDLSKNFGTEAATDLYKKFGRAAFLPITTMKRIISNENANVVVATDSPRFEQAALSAANELAIKSICIPTLFGNREISDKMLHETNSTFYRPKYDFAYVAHIKAKINILNSETDRDSDSVAVTGSPIFDEVIARYGNGYTSKMSKKYLNYKTIYFYATQSYGNSINMLKEVLLPFISQQQDIVLIVKPHPGEDVANYSFLQEINDVSLLLDVDANEISSFSDLVIIEDSTVGLEALLMKKNVVSVSLDANKCNNFRDFDLCSIVYNFSDLADFLRKFSLQNKSNYSIKSFYRKDSLSVDCIVKLIRKEL
jgi:hypothetical protein